MAINKTMEDWFLRGGEKPQCNGMQTVAVAVCQNCGHENPADEEFCNHCLAPLVGEPSTAEICGGDEYEDDLADDEDENDERKYLVTVRRTWAVRQEAKIEVLADCEETAMMKAEDIAEDEADEIDWDNVQGTDDYYEIESKDAEEL